MATLRQLMSRAIILALCLGISASAALAQSVGSNASLTATTTSSNVALPAPLAGSVIIAPATGATAEVFYKFGTTNAVTAATTDKSLPSGGICVSSIGNNAYLAAITATGSANVRITQITGGCPTFAGGGGGGGGGGGSTTANQGTAANLAGAWPEEITDGTNGPVAVKPASTQAAVTDPALVADPRPNSAATVSGTSTNPVSTYTLTATTTAYTAGQLIANNATAGSVTNPSFTIANTAGGAAINRLRLSTNDTTSTAWAGKSVQIDLWTASPTWTNGDRATWLPATGSASHLATFNCTFPSAVWGDGLGTECGISVGNFSDVKLSSGSTIYWSMQATGGSGVTGASKVFTMIPELLN